jgi:hypothetical protein
VIAAKPGEDIERLRTRSVSTGHGTRMHHDPAVGDAAGRGRGRAVWDGPHCGRCQTRAVSDCRPCELVRRRSVGGMHYRQFGSTGIEVSQLTFGGGAVGGLLINADRPTRLAALRFALDAGINWIDTAAQYGNGRS